MSDPLTSRFRLKPRSYYLQALEENKRIVALLLTLGITLPLFLFTSLPPVEVLEEVPVAVPETIDVPIEVNQTIEVEVNKTIEVEVNVTEEVIVNRTVGVNITEGRSIFLEPLPAPPLIDSDIVLCIDVSGSMDANRMPIAQAAIHRFLALLNQSNSLGLSNDRVALVSFAGIRDFDWSNDATIHASLDYLSNITHLNLILSETDSLVGNGWTDAWAGLNFSLDLILNSPRNTSTLRSILFLTDGAHNTGPWGVDVESGNYTGFLSEPAFFSDSREGGPIAQSPVKIARQNDVKIYSVGLFEGTSYEFDEYFLRNVSLNETFGAFGDFFVGNDTLSLSDSFLMARDTLSGWTNLQSTNVTLLNNGNFTLFSLNVSSEMRRIKWVLNWQDSSVNFNLTIIDPNGSILDIQNLNTSGIVPIFLSNLKSVLLDFPQQGLWYFNLTWNNISNPEIIKSRLLTYDPPIYIQSIIQYNSSENSILMNQIKEVKDAINSQTKDFLSKKLAQLNNSIGNQSVIFLINVTNKNPLFTYHNITPYLLGNFSLYNLTIEWIPPVASNLTIGQFLVFQFNLTFLEPTLLQGTLFFKVNCTEGYYDAIAQDVALDYRVITENVTIETYLENQTITIIENQTIVVTENQTIQTTIVSQMMTMVTKYTYNKQVFDTLKWAGFFISLGLIMSFLAVYVSAQAIRIRSFAKMFRSRLFPDQSALELALQEQGIDVSPTELSAVIDSTVNLDQFGENIFSLTGKRLTPEDLIRLTSGVAIDQIINRLSFVTGLSPSEIAEKLQAAPSVEHLIRELNLDQEKFLDIITKDEQVIKFQDKISSLIGPKVIIQSDVVVNDDIDIFAFRGKIRRKFS